ncbi:MAG: hypothetical protein V4659_03170 [Pseudomonadota bacterium]
MSAKLIFAVGVLGVGGYFGKQMASYDPTIYPYSKTQVQQILNEAKTVLPRRDGPGQIEIWGAGKIERGAALKMQYADWAPVIACDAIVTEIAPDKSRVVPNCEGPVDASSALSRTHAELRVPMFFEHIQSTLQRRAFDRKRVDNKEAAAVLKNLGGMQREALKASDEMQQMQAEAEEE